MIQQTPTLDYTYTYLQTMQAELTAQATALNLTGFMVLLDRLAIKDPHGYTTKT